MAVTLVFYSTSTCGYCKPIKTILNNLKTDYEDNPDVFIHDIVVDRDYGGMDSAREWGVVAVPTILVISDREEKERLVGDINRDKIIDAIERNL